MMDGFRPWFVQLVQQLHAEATSPRRSGARVEDAATFERLLRAIEQLRERGQMVWISIGEGRARVHVGERCPGRDWALLGAPRLAGLGPDATQAARR